MKKILIFPLFVMLVSFTNYPESKWKLVKNDRNIEVYSRYCKNSSLKEIKVSTSIKSSLSTIVAIIQDVHAFPEWIYMCSEARTVKRISNTEQIYYYVTDSPWPAMDRDAVIHGFTHQDPFTRIVTIRSVLYKNLIPHREDCVRLKAMTGEWKLTPLSDELVHIEYTLQVDPGGDIPLWLVNYSMKIGPYNTLNALINRVEQINPQANALKYIVEKY